LASPGGRLLTDATRRTRQRSASVLGTGREGGVSRAVPSVTRHGPGRFTARRAGPQARPGGRTARSPRPSATADGRTG
jgi:hypothetical protein